MTDVDERVAWLTARLDEMERVAREACHGGQGDWHQDDPDGEGGRIEDERGNVVVYDEGSPSGWEAEHIALNDPRTVLARVEADRQVLAEIATWKHDYHDDDTWYSCALAESTWADDRSPGSGCSDDDRSGGPCDCGLDRRRGVIVRALLSAHRFAPGFREEWLNG